MTPLTKTIRRVTLETYGYGKQARKLVVSLERGDLICIREHGRRRVLVVKAEQGNENANGKIAGTQGGKSCPPVGSTGTRRHRAAFQ